MHTEKYTPAQILKLREATGLSLLKCRKALIEANGDYEHAIEILRNKTRNNSRDWGLFKST